MPSRRNAILVTLAALFAVTTQADPLSTIGPNDPGTGLQNGPPLEVHLNCLSCTTSTLATLFPDVTTQTVSGILDGPHDGPGRTDTYGVEMCAGSTYRFSFCAVEGGSYNFTCDSASSCEATVCVHEPDCSGAPLGVQIEFCASNIDGYDFTPTADGIYIVQVESQNIDGTGDYTMAYRVLDADCCNDSTGPDITCTASSPFAAPPPSRAANRLEAATSNWPALRASASSEEDAAVAAEAKQAFVADQELVDYDGRDSRHHSEPDEALSCGAPVGSGTLSTSNAAPFAFYNVTLVAGTGGFTASTGTNHPDGSGLNVIFPGPGTSDITFRVHNAGIDYLSPSGGQACAFNPPDTGAEPNNIGIEQEWTRTVGGMDLTLRQEIVTFGTNDDDSGVRLTLCASNDAGSAAAAEMGYRWQIDYMNSGDDGPGFAPVTCTPFEIGAERFTEHELAASEIVDFYRIQNNTGAPIFGNFTDTTEIAGFPGTGTPDRLVYGQWGSMSGSPWNYLTNEGASTDSDSAVLYYFGYAPGDAVVVAPGATECRSVVIFTKGDNQDCGTFTPGTGFDATVQICPNDTATVGATATDDCASSPTVTLSASTPGGPVCATTPACTMMFPNPGTFIYTWEAEDNNQNTTTCESAVVVLDPTDPQCNQPPSCDAGGPYASGCATAAIDGATIADPNTESVSYTWTSSNPAVVVTPSSGSVIATPGGTPVPSATATLTGDACGESAILTLTVIDGAGGESSCQTTVTFQDSTVPSITCPGDVAVQCDEDVPAADNGSVTASDSCSGVTISSSDQIGQDTCPRTIVRTYTATDACGNNDSCEQTITVDDTIAPVVDPLAPIDVQCVEDVPAPNVGLVTFTDNCLAPSTVEHVGDASDGQSCPETIIRTYRVIDGCGNPTEVMQTITVLDTTAPTVDPLAPIDVQCIEQVPAPDPGQVTYSDNCAAPATVTHVADVSDGLSCPESIARTYRVIDGCGNATDVTQTITVLDTTPPTVDPLPPIDVQCIEQVPAQDPGSVTYSDNCAAAGTVTHVADVSDGLSCPESIARTYRVSDGCGNTTEVTQTITVLDTTPPTVDPLAPINVQCGDDVPPADPGVVSYADNCAAPSAVIHVGDVSDGAGCPETITRTYQVVDGCGNSADVTQTIVVDDTIPPDIGAILAPALPLPASSAASPASVCSAPNSRQFRVTCDSPTDNCDPDPMVSATLVIVSHEVPEPGTCVPNIVEIPVECGELVEIQLLAPACPATPNSAAAGVSVNSAGVLVVSAESVVLQVTATDDCGNATTVSYDPALEPSPLCDEVLSDGTCCPAIGAPEASCDPTCGASYPARSARRPEPNGW